MLFIKNIYSTKFSAETFNFVATITTAKSFN